MDILFFKTKSEAKSYINTLKDNWINPRPEKIKDSVGWRIGVGFENITPTRYLWINHDGEICLNDPSQTS